MPRRNHRETSYVPLDMTPADVKTIKPKVRPIRSHGEIDRIWEKRDHERQDRAERQQAARVDKAIDWSVCIVPGCGESLVSWGGLIHRNKGRRDSTMELPICYTHSAVIWTELVHHHIRRDQFIDEIVEVNARLSERLAREKVQEKAEFLARQDGDIYFIRLNGLVKVGWSRDLRQRVRSYGASAELLVSYPATRDDETYLHRQLRPALAKGREWYEDGPVVQAFIDEALSKYGEPRLVVEWTTPKRIVAGKRHR